MYSGFYCYQKHEDCGKNKIIEKTKTKRPQQQ